MAKRARMQERKKERQQVKRRNRQLMIIGVVVVIVLFVAVIYVMSSLPIDAPLPGTLARYEDLRRGFTEEGYPRLGSPNAPVLLVEYSSFTCPHCLTFEEAVFPNLLPLIARGDIQFVYVPMATGGGNYVGANLTALCAGEQGKFWEMHDTLFSWQATFGNNSAFQDNRLRTGADVLGLNMDAFNSCTRSGRADRVFNAAADEGVDSTPTVRIDGAEVDATWDAIESVLNEKGPFSNLEPGTISGIEAQQNAATEAVEVTPEATEAIEMTPEATDAVEMTSEATEAPVEATAEATEAAD